MPMTRSEMPAAVATSVALSTTRSAPTLSMTAPTTTSHSAQATLGFFAGAPAPAPSREPASFSSAPSFRPICVVRTRNAAKARSSTTPSNRVTSPPVLASSASSAQAATLTGISKRMVPRESATGAMTAERPRMSSRLARQLPTTLPKAMSAWPAAAEVMLTTSSGREVPMATTVSPATRSGMPKRAASRHAPSTRRLAPPTSRPKPTTIARRLRSTTILSGRGYHI